MDSPLLTSRTETHEIVPANNSMPSNEQQYPSIYRVPAVITNLNPKAYQPQVVSFGPYHHDDDHLRPMEEHKHRALRRFLELSRMSLSLYLESLRNVLHKLEDSYNALDPKWKEGNQERFLELMIRDGCFMLEIMRTTLGEKHNYAPNDPIFNTDMLTYITPYIRRDMLMLENQLPMLVLFRLVAVENHGSEPIEYINNLILRFYSLDTCTTVRGRCLHVLDVFRKGLLKEPENVQQEPENVGPEGRKEIIWSATELNAAGIRFKMSKTSSLKDISFARGELSLPAIVVEHATESMFLNAMTFERLHIGAGSEVTSYVTFMDNIINSEQDVALLHAQGIIQNAIGSDKAVAKLFNSLCKEVTLKSNSRVDVVHKKISKYFEQRWNIWGANLKHTYFRSPWTMLSLIAAIFLFVLTIIQTVYAVLSYIG